MKLYLMRHGHSPSTEEARVPSDSLRPLSARGREEAARALANLLAKGGRPGLILASPLTRAQQTAQALASLLRPPPPLRTYEPLANRISGADLVRRVLADELGADEVLLVGHQPQVGEAAACLLRSVFPLQTAGIVAVRVSAEGRGELLWAANPEDLPA